MKKVVSLLLVLGLVAMPFREELADRIQELERKVIRLTVFVKCVK